MSKEKSFEYIERKIKEAAENTQPVFDEQSWAKMEALLDKKDKRKPILWLWFLVPLFLISGWGAYQFIYKNEVKNNTPKIETAKVNDKDIKTLSSSLKLNKRQYSASDSNINSSAKDFDKAIDKSDKNSDNKNAVTDKVNYQSAINIITKSKNKILVTASVADDDLLNVSTKNKSGIKNDISAIISHSDIINETSVDKISLNKPDEPMQLISKQNNIAQQDTAAVTVKNKTAIKQNNKASHFYFLASAGADIGSVKMFSFKNSSLAPRYGLGFGYQLNNKLSVQTGFYISRKKYIAGPDDYHPKQGSYWNMVSIIKVNANCLVYEIPLATRYNFINKKATTYYATTGVSSYIMKREDYNYYYTRNNIPAQSAWTYTGNKKLFSVITLSAGIEKKINEKFSIQAEPSVAIPIAGVGDGQVKIFSSTLQVALKYQPSKKHK